MTILLVLSTKTKEGKQIRLVKYFTAIRSDSKFTSSCLLKKSMLKKTLQ